MKKQYLVAGAMVATVVLGAAPALSASISIVSDGSTLTATVPLNSLSLTTGDTSGLTFGPDVVGSFGTFTPVPAGAPAGTEVVNIPPGDGESGFFRVSFTLPTGFSSASISGAANADDNGMVFLNGNALAGVTEFGDTPFASTNQSYFTSGTNFLLISDNNSGGGPSGAAFYANITYQASQGAVPEPATWALMLVGFGVVGTAIRHRARTAIRLSYS